MRHYTSNIMLPLNQGKDVSLDFGGGSLTSDSGVLLLAQADRSIGLTRKLADAIQDNRQQTKISHSFKEVLQARILAIAAGYPDANDLDSLRRDPAFKMACGRNPATGDALVSQPTLSRYENGLTKADLMRMGVAVAQCVIDQLPKDTRHVTLDIDATDDPCHGQQEFEGFNAYYDNHCYIPLLVQITDGKGTQWPVAALLRSGKTSTLAGVGALLRRLVGMLRLRFPDIKITVRGDSAFGCDKVLRCLDALKVHYLLGIASNSCLTELGASVVQRCLKKSTKEGPGCKTHGSFPYQAGSWDRARRVIVKVENIQGETNARYVVTNLWHLNAERGYEDYCGRGDQENRIKELKLDLASGRTSCHRFLANQGRLLMHLAAYVLWTVVRLAAAGTRWAKMQVNNLRLQLLKVAARVTESTRRVWIQVCSSYPYQEAWCQVQARLGAPNLVT
jgi:hypothetical protein